MYAEDATIRIPHLCSALAPRVIPTSLRVFPILAAPVGCDSR
jgi:hypothetical protein